MLIKVKFFKVLGPPAEPVANAVYFVKDEETEVISLFVTDEEANLTGFGDAAYILSVIAPSMALKAPLASPALTGTPTAPTQSLGNSSTRLATTAFVAAAITALINAAPGALDTLKELSDAINDDEDFAATITTALAGKVPTTRT